MRIPHWHVGIPAIMALAGVPSAAQQTKPQAPAQPPAAARVIGAHQIDRYEAIEQVRRDLAANPKNVTDWVLLGELAQETAAVAPADRAPGYYRLARESFENALKFQPGNAALKAAAAFAREQEQGAEQFAQTRRQITANYLVARRRELAGGGNAPLLQVYPAPAGGAPTTTGPQYQSYVGAQGQPYTYQKHYDSFFGPVKPRTPDQRVTATERSALVKPGARMAPP